jgi:hypothetical protein
MTSRLFHQLLDTTIPRLNGRTGASVRPGGRPWCAVLPHGRLREPWAGLPRRAYRAGVISLLSPSIVSIVRAPADRAAADAAESAPAELPSLSCHLHAPRELHDLWLLNVRRFATVWFRAAAETRRDLLGDPK